MHAEADEDEPPDDIRDRVEREFLLCGPAQQGEGNRGLAIVVYHLDQQLPQRGARR